MLDNIDGGLNLKKNKQVKITETKTNLSKEGTVLFIY